MESTTDTRSTATSSAGRLASPAYSAGRPVPELLAPAGDWEAMRAAAAAQSAAEFVPRMKQLGIEDFRVDLLRETPAKSIALLDRYARVLAGLEDGRAAWRQLKVLSQLGVTRGTLEG